MPQTAPAQRPAEPGTWLIFADTGGTGAAMLKARQCQGCRLELFGRELAAVRNADPHEVVRCDNCGRILVRTAESGL